MSHDQVKYFPVDSAVQPPPPCRATSLPASCHWQKTYLGLILSLLYWYLYLYFSVTVFLFQQACQLTTMGREDLLPLGLTFILDSIHNAGDHRHSSLHSLAFIVESFIPISYNHLTPSYP